MSRAPRRRRANAAPASSETAVSRSDLSSNPNDWMYTNPAGRPRVDGFVFGVLRHDYKKRTNTAAAFGLVKLCPIPTTTNQPTAERSDVVLPPGADDALAQPTSFLIASDDHAIQSALLICLTLRLAGMRTHEAWERLRGFAGVLARERQLGSLVVLHVPGRVGAPGPTHGHLLIAPRRLGGGGMATGGYDEELVHDAGQTVLERLWLRHLAADGPAPA